MNFQNIRIKSEYRNLIDDIVEDFYTPILSNAVLYKRAVGFFSSSALVELTKGISGLITNSGKIQLIASPYLSADDIEAIRAGYKERYAIIENSLIRNLLEPIDKFEARRLNLLANLIAVGVLEIKIAVLEKENDIGMFHEKMGLMYDEENNIIAFTGSMNESSNAFSHNYESIDVFCSWTFDSGRVLSKEIAFQAMWEDTEPHIRIIDFPKLNEALLKKYKYNNEIDVNIDKDEFGMVIRRKSESSMISLPSDVELRKYQIDAINRWEQQEFVGIYDMATGTGKTFTALGSMERLLQRTKNLAIFVICPYIHLVNQWEEDAVLWGVNPIIAHSQSRNKNWPETLRMAYKRFRRTGKSFMCIATNATFRDDMIQNILKNVSLGMNVVLVVDEVHNFGSENLSKLLPPNIRFRLGLSATVERYRDKVGTGKIIDYFGKKCIEYPIQRAIEEKALVEYEYYPIIVSLLEEELEEYQYLSKQIAQYIVKENGKTTVAEIGQQILYKRSRLIAGAENKLNMLEQYLLPYKDASHILVYCGATKGLEFEDKEKERQIDKVEKLIGLKLKMTTHRFTSEESLEMRRLLKEGFSDGEFQVITAIKCLDEGVNIPNIQTAFILASSRNPKEFIQRRGRVLRKAPDKTRATIYDFVTLPRELNAIRYGDYKDDKSIVIGEMARIYEFGRHSVNSRIAYEMLERIQEAYCINIPYENLQIIMEEEYGEQ